MHHPETLLNTVVFVLDTGVPLHAGKDHHYLRRLSFNSQITFVKHEDGQIIMRYTEDLYQNENK